MQAVIDEQGRVEIPFELREKLHLVAGTVVNLEAVDDRLEISPNWTARDVKLVREGSMLVISTADPISVEDVNRALEMGRQERMNRIMGVETTGS
jgi:AbrB family looped-hinge helix DNA binding protein